MPPTVTGKAFNCIAAAVSCVGLSQTPRAPSLVRTKGGLHMNQGRTTRLGFAMIRKNTIKSRGVREFNPPKSRFSSRVPRLRNSSGRVLTKRNQIGPRERRALDNISKRRLPLLMSRAMSRVLGRGPRSLFFFKKSIKLVAPIWSTTSLKMEVKLKRIALKRN